MTLAEALKTLWKAPADRSAAHALQREVNFIGQTTLRIFPELRDDFASRVVMKLLSRSPLPAIFERTPSLQADHEPALEPICRKYVKRMLFHLEIDEVRRRERETRRLARDAEPDFVDPDEERARRMTDAIHGMIDEVQVLLQRVLDDALDSRAPEYRPHLRVAWGELWALAVEDRGMNEVLQARATETPSATPTQLRNKVLQAHRRLRLALGEAVDRLARAGDMDPEEAELARKAIDLLLVRCHRRKT